MAKAEFQLSFGAGRQTSRKRKTLRRCSRTTLAAMATRCTGETIATKEDGLAPGRAIVGKITAGIVVTTVESVTVIGMIGAGTEIVTAMTGGAPHPSANTEITAATGREEDATDSILMMIIKEGEKVS